MERLKKILTDEEIELVEQARGSSIYESIFTQDEKWHFEEIVYKIIDAIEDGKI